MKPSDIEVAKVIRSMQDIGVSEDLQSAVMKGLAVDSVERIQNAVAGMREEDEFSILCHLMGQCDSIAPVGQRPLPGNNAVAPDLLCVFRSGCWPAKRTRLEAKPFPAFVEVKSTKNNTWSIKPGQLKKRRRFCEQYRLPLLFAVRLISKWSQPTWCLVQDHGGDEGIEVGIDSMIGGLRSVLWDERSWFIRPGLTLLYEYDRHSEGCGIRNERHGGQTRLGVSVPGRAVEYAPPDHVVRWSMFFDAFDLDPIETTCSGSITTEWRRPRVDARFDADLVINMNRLFSDDEGSMCYMPGRIACHSDVGSMDHLVDRDFVLSIAGSLAERDWLFLVSTCDAAAQAARWEQLFGGR